MKRIISTVLSLVLLASSSMYASADSSVVKYNRDRVSLNESQYTVSAEATPVTETGEKILVKNYGKSPYMTYDIGHGSGEWNTWFNWARAKTETWPWATATYVYAKATVTANGEATQTESKSSTSRQSVTTDKIYQSVKKGRNLTTEHTITGKHDYDRKEKTERYSGNFDW